MIIENFKIKAEGSGDNATLRTYIVDSSEYFEQETYGVHLPGRRI